MRAGRRRGRGSGDTGRRQGWVGGRGGESRQNKDAKTEAHWQALHERGERTEAEIDEDDDDKDEEEEEEEEETEEKEDSAPLTSGRTLLL